MCQTGEKTRIVSVNTFFGQRIGKPLNSLKCGGSASGVSLIRAGTKVVLNSIASHGPKPAAEAVARPVAMKIINGRRDGSKRLLDDILGVTGL